MNSIQYPTLSVFNTISDFMSCIVKKIQDYYGLINIHGFVQVVDVHIFSGIYHSHWRLVHCFSLGIQMHARDVVYIS